jgi:hypothetical protein
VMRGVKLWMAAVAAACVAGCANGGGGLTSPTPLAPASPSAPSSCAVPGAPDDLSASVTGSGVDLSWSAVGDAVDYVVIVGWTPASAETLLTNSSETHHWIESVPSGTHFARVHAHNWCGTSDASEPVTFTVE